MPRRSSIVVALLLALLLPTAIFGVRFALFLSQSVAPKEAMVITVPTGASFADVARRLSAAGVVADVQQLTWLARWRGDLRKIKAGEYEFSEPSTPVQVLNRLVSGDVRRYRFTVPEGLTLREIASSLESAGFGPKENFLQMARSGDFARTLGIEASSLEGYLFPETYTLTSGMTSEQILQAMVRQFKSKVTPELREKAGNLGLDLHQMVTLASIIQKEAGNREEMPLISAVFHNRLRRGMPLQADPTVIYGIEDFDGNLTREHLRTPTPYNTYRRTGLPPGPIANPGEEALLAAAGPADVRFLYFVSRGDGTHIFSATLREHNEAVQQFQKRRRN